MDGNWSCNTTKAQTLKSSLGSISPLQVDAQNIIRRGPFPHQHPHSKFHIVDPYASLDSNSSSPTMNSPLLHYLRWGSGSSSSSSGSKGGLLSPLPMNSIENFEALPLRLPPVFKTPVKIEEDVLVMDGILLNSEGSRSSRGGAGRRMRSPLSSSGGRLFSSSASSSSSGGKENCSFYKMEKCRSWEDLGTCRFGSKCQFAHAMEEQRRNHCLMNSKSEELLCRSFGSGPCIDGRKPPSDQLQKKVAAPSVKESAAANFTSVEVGYITPIQPAKTISRVHSTIVSSSNDWSPLDDGIEVDLPSVSGNHNPPSREAIDTNIQAVLYGSTIKKRLPAFMEFCPAETLTV